MVVGMCVWRVGVITGGGGDNWWWWGCVCGG